MTAGAGALSFATQNNRHGPRNPDNICFTRMAEAQGPRVYQPDTPRFSTFSRSRDRQLVLHSTTLQPSRFSIRRRATSKRRRIDHRSIDEAFHLGPHVRRPRDCFVSRCTRTLSRNLYHHRRSLCEINRHRTHFSTRITALLFNRIFTFRSLRATVFLAFSRTENSP